MSRINIDDKLWSDARFDALKNILGNELLAIGMVVKSFRIAQDFWKTESKLIPKEIWNLYDFSAMEKVGLAEKLDNGVYIKGSNEQFEWLKKKQLAGKISAQTRRKKFGSAQPTSNTSRTPAEHLFENPRTPPEPPTPTPTPTLNTYTQTDPSVHKAKKQTKPKVGTHEVIARYCELFEQRYGIKAVIAGVEAGQLGRLTKAHGQEQAIKIVEGYFDLNDQFIANQCHPVGMIEKQINKILVSQSKPHKEPERRWLEIPTGDKQ